MSNYINISPNSIWSKLFRDSSEIIGKDRTSVGTFFCIHFLFKEAISWLDIICKPNEKDFFSKMKFGNL